MKKNLNKQKNDNIIKNNYIISIKCINHNEIYSNHINFLKHLKFCKIITKTIKNFWSYEEFNNWTCKIQILLKTTFIRKKLLNLHSKKNDNVFINTTQNLQNNLNDIKLDKEFKNTSLEKTKTENILYKFYQKRYVLFCNFKHLHFNKHFNRAIKKLNVFKFLPRTLQST